MRELAGYVLLTRLASGALGELFLARPRDDRTRAVVLKRISDEVAGLAFNRVMHIESTAGKAFAHEDAVPLLEVGHVGDASYLVSPLVRGQPLSDVLRRARVEGTPLSQPMVAWIFSKVAGVLAAAHQIPWFEGAPGPLVHGALCPRAVLLTYEGQVKLTGIGYGRARAKVPPTPARLPYSAPEVLHGREIAPRTDAYGVGICLHDGLSGRAVYRHPDPEATRAAVLAGNAPPLSPRSLSIDPAVADLVQALMAPRVEARPADLHVVQESLLEAAGDTSGFSDELAGRLAALFAEERDALERRLDAGHRATQRVHTARALGLEPGPRPAGPPTELSLPNAPLVTATPAAPPPLVPPPALVPPLAPGRSTHQAAEGLEAASGPASPPATAASAAGSSSVAPPVAPAQGLGARAAASNGAARASSSPSSAAPARPVAAPEGLTAPAAEPRGGARAPAPRAAASPTPPVAEGDAPEPAPAQASSEAAAPSVAASTASGVAVAPASEAGRPAPSVSGPAPSSPPLPESTNTRGGSPSSAPAERTSPGPSSSPTASPPPVEAAAPPAVSPPSGASTRPLEASAPTDGSASRAPASPEVGAAPAPASAPEGSPVSGPASSGDEVDPAPSSAASPTSGPSGLEADAASTEDAARLRSAPDAGAGSPAPEPAPRAAPPRAAAAVTAGGAHRPPPPPPPDDDDFEVFVEEPEDLPTPKELRGPSRPPEPAPSSSFAAAILGIGRPRASSPPPPRSAPPPKPRSAPPPPPPDPARPFSGLLDQAAAEGVVDHLPEFEAPQGAADDLDLDLVVERPVEVDEAVLSTAADVLAEEGASEVSDLGAPSGPEQAHEAAPSSDTSPPPAEPPAEVEREAPVAEPPSRSSRPPSHAAWTPSSPPPGVLSAPPEPRAELRFGRYEVRRPVRSSALRPRYLAHDPELDRDVWLDVEAPAEPGAEDPSGPNRGERFVRSARWLSQLRHPRLPTIHDIGLDGEARYVVRAPVAGGPLETAPAWTEETVRQVVLDLASALDTLHQAELCAGGLRMQDVWRDDEGRAAIVDLPRLFRFDDPPEETPGSTLDLVPPECMEGGPFERAGDLFSLGLLAHRLLTGQEALPEESEARRRALRGGQIPVPDVEDGVLQAALRQLLAPAPRARFARAAEVVAFLARGSPMEGGANAAEAHVDVVLVDPDVTPAQARRILRARGVRAAVFSTVDPAITELGRLGARTLVVARSVRIDESELRRRVRAVSPKADVRFVPPAASRMVGPPLSLEGIVEAWSSLAPRVVALGTPESGFVPTVAARTMAIQMQLGLRSELLSTLAAATRLLARRLGESPSRLSLPLPEEVPEVLEAAERVEAETLAFEEARPAARVVVLADGFFRMTRLDGLAPSRALADLKARYQDSSAGRRALDALVVHLRDLYATGDLAPPAADAPQVVLARRSRTPGLVKMLEFDGLQVEEAEDGHQAWDLLRALRPSVAILDADLAGRDGASLVELSRVHPALGAVRFLLLGAPDDQALRQRIATLEGVWLVDRGASVEALRARISSLVEPPE